MDFKRGKTVFLAGLLALVVVWMVIFVGRIADYKRLSQEYEDAQLTIAALAATTNALETEVVRAGSDEAVIEWAYEQRKWIREGDQRIAVIPVEGTPESSLIIKTPTPEPQNLFRIWWELFFNTKP
jgi:cell division protein FtsB